MAPFRGNSAATLVTKFRGAQCNSGAAMRAKVGLNELLDGGRTPRDACTTSGLYTASSSLVLLLGSLISSGQVPGSQECENSGLNRLRPRSVLCFAVMRPDSYEQGHRKGAIQKVCSSARAMARGPIWLRVALKQTHHFGGPPVPFALSLRGDDPPAGA